MALQVRLLERGATAEQTREVSVNKPEFLIGRAPDCDLRLRMSEVSRHHCIIRTAADEVTLVDLGSSNGTFLNGHRVRSQAALHSGDEIRLGECHFVVDLGDRGSIELGLTSPDSAATTRRIPKDKRP